MLLMFGIRSCLWFMTVIRNLTFWQISAIKKKKIICIFIFNNNGKLKGIDTY